MAPDPRQHPRAGEVPEVPSRGVRLRDVIPGYEPTGKPVSVFLDPSLAADAEGQIRADFHEPDEKTVDAFDETYHGYGKKHRGKPRHWPAMLEVLRRKFIDLHGVAEEDAAPLLAAHGGSWKNVLCNEPRVRRMATKLVDLYIGKCRVLGSVAEDEDTDEE